MRPSSRPMEPMNIASYGKLDDQPERVTVMQVTYTNGCPAGANGKHEADELIRALR